MSKLGKLYVICVVLGCYLNMSLTFLIAYLNDMRILVTINDYGEANAELLLLGSSFILLIYYLAQYLRTPSTDSVISW